ncbi:hypothetical protein V1477_006539 [Vespula maculifrons]|uniref:Uncharacterized protein n=1 Tax=Vespula maculifrons TaxID=7453 RepID=A0ABD2CJ52_VESMC
MGHSDFHLRIRKTFDLDRTELGHGIHSSSGEGGNVLASQQLTTFRLLDSGFNTITAKPDIPRERRVYDNGSLEASTKLCGLA